MDDGIRAMEPAWVGGDKKQAVFNYEKVLELNPKNKNVIKKLEELKK